MAPPTTNQLLLLLSRAQRAARELALPHTDEWVLSQGTKGVEPWRAFSVTPGTGARSPILGVGSSGHLGWTKTEAGITLRTIGNTLEDVIHYRTLLRERAAEAAAERRVMIPTQALRSMAEQQS